MFGLLKCGLAEKEEEESVIEVVVGGDDDDEDEEEEDEQTSSPPVEQISPLEPSSKKRKSDITEENGNAKKIALPSIHSDSDVVDLDEVESQPLSSFARNKSSPSVRSSTPPPSTSSPSLKSTIDLSNAKPAQSSLPPAQQILPPQPSIQQPTHTSHPQQTSPTITTPQHAPQSQLPQPHLQPQAQSFPQLHQQPKPQQLPHFPQIPPPPPNGFQPHPLLAQNSLSQIAIPPPQYQLPFNLPPNASYQDLLLGLCY